MLFGAIGDLASFSFGGNSEKCAGWISNQSKAYLMLKTVSSQSMASIVAWGNHLNLRMSLGEVVSASDALLSTCAKKLTFLGLGDLL